MMRTVAPILIFALSVSALYAALPSLAQETIDTRIGKLTFESSYPSKETVQKLYDEMDFQRATQAYLWAFPAVSCGAFPRGLADFFGAARNDITI
jgi:hypothetical protein